jgi:hypothetical protein
VNSTNPDSRTHQASAWGFTNVWKTIAHLYPIGSAASRRSASKRYLVHLLYLLSSFSAIISLSLLGTMLLVIIYKSSTLEANNALFLPLLTIPHLCRQRREPKFVNFEGAQEFYVPSRQATWYGGIDSLELTPGYSG